MDNRDIEINIVGKDSASSVFKQVSDNLSQMSGKSTSSLDKISSGLNRYNNAMHGIYRATQVAIGGAGYLVYKFTKDSINEFADFERQHAKTMGAIATNYDKTAKSQQKFMDDQQKMKEQALKLGTWGPNNNGALYKSAEVSSTQTALVKAGFSASQTQNTVEPVMKFAGGNDLSLDTATEYAVNLGEIYNTPRTPTAYKAMLDKVTKAADISTVDVPDLFESLKYAGPIASSMGRSLDETLGVLSVMGNSGLKGSMSGTGLQAFFTRILDPVGVTDAALKKAPSSKVSDKLEQFVQSVTDSNGKFKDMPTVTKNLDDAMTGLNDKEQAWFSHKLFGLFQMKAAYTLAKNGGDPLKNVVDEISNQSAGANDLKWDIMLKSAYGVKERLANAWSGTKIDVGYRLSPFTNAIMDELYNVFANKGNYTIDFSKIKSGLQTTTDMITEQYGKQFGELVQNIGNFGIDSSQILKSIMPTVGGFGIGYAKLLSGDIPGALSAFKDGISDAKDNISKLPPDLQAMAKQVENATIVLSVLAGVNFVAKIAGNVANIGQFISSFKNPQKKSSKGGIGNAVKNVADVRVQSMNVVASKVMITGGVDRHGEPLTGSSEGTRDTVIGKSNTRRKATMTDEEAEAAISGILDEGEDDKPKKKTTKRKKKSVATGSSEPTKPVEDETPVTGAGTSTKPRKPPTTGSAPTEQEAPATPPVKSEEITRAPIGGKLMAGFNKASWIYAIGEMFGINDFLLDKVGAKEGTKSREAIDIGRTVLDWGFTGSFIDSTIFNGAIKQGIKSAIPKLTTVGISAVQALIESVGIAAATSMGVISVGGGAVVGHAYYKNKEAEKNVSQVKQAVDTGHPVYFNKDGSLMKNSDGTLTTLPNKSERQANYNKHKYEYGGGESQTYLSSGPPTKPNVFSQLFDTSSYERYKDLMDLYNNSQSQIRVDMAHDRSKYNTVQAIYKENTGKQLDWNAYQATKPQWDKILPDSLFGSLSSLTGPVQQLYQGVIAAQPAFEALKSVKFDNNGNTDVSGLSNALAVIMSNSGQLSNQLLSIANYGNMTSQYMGSISMSANTMSTNASSMSNSMVDVVNKISKYVPQTGDYSQDAINVGDAVGAMKGTGFDFGAYLTALNPLHSIQTDGSNILSKLDPITSGIGDINPRLNDINSSIKSIPPPSVNVSVPAPIVNVKVDSNGNVTTESSGSSMIQSGNPLDQLFNRYKTRYGG